MRNLISNMILVKSCLAWQVKYSWYMHRTKSAHFLAGVEVHRVATRVRGSRGGRSADEAAEAEPALSGALRRDRQGAPGRPHDHAAVV